MRRHESAANHSRGFFVACLLPCTMSHAAQLPSDEHPTALSEHSSPSIRRVSSTAQVMPRSRMCLLVLISESILRPLTIRVIDMASTKKATNSTEIIRTSNHVGISKENLIRNIIQNPYKVIILLEISFSMKIIISGAGEVGSHLAKMLSGGMHDITVIDSDPKLLDDISGIADVVTIEGDSTTFSILKKASVRKADLFLAVNQVENINIISAMLAKQLGAKKSIARIDNNEYLAPNNKEIFINMGIDYLFYPEKVAAREVINLLGHTSTTEYVDFSGGKLSLVVFKLDATSPLIDKTPVDLTQDPERMTYRIVAVSKGDTTIIPHADDRFAEGDTLYVITTQEASGEVSSMSGNRDVQVKNIMILGGSRIGVRIAEELQGEMNIKLVEYNAEKAYKLAERLERTLIINEDGRNTESMLEEGLGNMDAFVAVTGRSETNILTSMLAKRMDVKKVIAEVENLNYINLAKSIGIDTVINKKLITASNIFRFTMNTDVQAIKCLTGSDAEVMEFIVKPNSPATKCKIRDLGFPSDATIGGIVRGDRVLIAVGSTEIAAYDRVVVFAKPNVISQMGRFFN